VKNQHIKNLFELNIAIVFISTSGVLGRSISFLPEITIWWRCFFAAIFIGLFCWYKKTNLAITTRKDAISLFLSGFLLGGHWVTYFYALHLSNVAIGMLSLFTYPVITALLEPVFFKIKISNYQLFLSFLVLVGIYFLTPELNFENSYTKGVAMGIISAFFYALRNILTKKNLSHFNASKVMFYQMIVIILLLFPVLLQKNEHYTELNNWGRLLTLALLTTTIGHTLFVNSFKHFKISAVSIMSSMSPIYGIIFGMVFLNEIPSLSTFFGGALILTTVIIESIQTKKHT
jgi:drug/metabolite transporter (DMT)-like permease